MSEPIIDAWIQHPTPRFIAHDMFASLRRWMRLDVIPQEIPVALTIAALDAAGVNRALASAWWGPGGPLLSNDDVAKTVSSHPDRFAGITDAAAVVARRNRWVAPARQPGGATTTRRAQRNQQEDDREPCPFGPSHYAAPRPSRCFPHQPDTDPDTIAHSNRAHVP